MKRVCIAVVILGLFATACASNQSAGVFCTPKLIAQHKPCVSSTVSAPPSAKPPSPTPTKTKSATPVVVKTTTPPVRRGNTWQLAVTGSSPYWSPDSLRVLIGDTIVFTNKDSTNNHTFTGDKNEWSSPEVAPGKTWKWKVNIPLGHYTFHDKVIPYIVGGILDVVNQ